MRSTNAVLIACLALAAPGLVAAAPARSRPVRVTGGSGQSITPPSGWRRLERSDGALDFLSPGRRAEGVVIGRGQAELLVTQVPGGSADSLPRAVLADAADLHVIRRRMVTLATTPSDDRCGVVEELEALDDVGPGVQQRLNLFYCRTGASAWRVLLRSWVADDDGRRRRDTAVAVTRSLRTVRPSPGGAVSRLQPRHLSPDDDARQRKAAPS